MMLSLDEIKIRNDFTSEDLRVVSDLHAEVYRNEFGYLSGFEKHVTEGLDEFGKEFDESKDKLWLCEHDGKIIGSMFLKGRGSSAQLRYFLILPGYRKLGLGSRLMTLFVDSCRLLGYSHSYLWTTDDLHEAASLYRKFGFMITEEIPSDSFGKKLLEQKYELKI